VGQSYSDDKTGATLSLHLSADEHLLIGRIARYTLALTAVVLLVLCLLHVI
jgi:hypothetical protein